MNDPQCCALLILFFICCARLLFAPGSLALTQQSSVAADDAARNVREMEETCMMAVLHFDQAVKVDPVSKKQTQQNCELCAHMCWVCLLIPLSVVALICSLFL